MLGQVRDLRNHPYFARMAGNIRVWSPDAVLVPFDAQTPPLEILQADLTKLLHCDEATAADASTQPRLSLDVNLVAAHAEPRDSKVEGVFCCDLGVIDSVDGQVLWKTRIVERYTTNPVYVTSREIEEALNGAYCQGLRAIAQALASEAARSTAR